MEAADCVAVAQAVAYPLASASSRIARARRVLPTPAAPASTTPPAPRRNRVETKASSSLLPTSGQLAAGGEVAEWIDFAPPYPTRRACRGLTATRSACRKDDVSPDRPGMRTPLARFIAHLVDNRGLDQKDRERAREPRLCGRPRTRP